MSQHICVQQQQFFFLIVWDSVNMALPHHKIMCAEICLALGKCEILSLRTCLHHLSGSPKFLMLAFYQFWQHIHWSRLIKFDQDHSQYKPCNYTKCHYSSFNLWIIVQKHSAHSNLQVQHTSPVGKTVLIKFILTCITANLDYYFKQFARLALHVNWIPWS